MIDPQELDSCVILYILLRSNSGTLWRHLPSPVDSTLGLDFGLVVFFYTLGN